jgi:uncharacterized YigZ family protein
VNMMFDDTYHMISDTAEGLYKDKGSKFIALAFPVVSEEAVKQKLEEIRKSYHDAHHHCYAYVLGFDKSAQRYNDDGEPSGTAGRPIFGQIQSKDLTNILVIVIRYFGGTKLGVSGLITAYKSATSDALNQASILNLTINDVYELTYEYPLMNEVMRVIKDEDLKIVEQDFQLSCKLSFQVRKNNSNRLYERFNKIHGVKIHYLKTV